MSRHPTVVAHLVYIGMSAMAADAVERITPDLKVAGNDNPVGGAASPGQLRVICDMLLTRTEDRSSLAQSLADERVIHADEMLNVFRIGPRRYGDPPPPSPVLLAVREYAMGPFLFLQARESLQVMSNWVALAKYSDWPQCQTAIGAMPGADRYHGVVKLMDSLLKPAYERAFLQEFRFETDCRIAAIVLAVHWYRADHGGNFPAALEELVPGYLPAVPLDPMDPGRKSLRYHSGPDPIIFSVSQDGIDDGGSEIPLNRLNPDNAYEQKDYVIHLKRHRRLSPAEVDPPPPSSQP